MSDSGADGGDLEAVRLLADLILAQEAGIADGSLTAAGGYVWPTLRAGTVPPFGEILAGLREDHRREGFWDDSVYGGASGLAVPMKHR